jgi:Ca2+-binding EF-hand superfamily protein
MNFKSRAESNEIARQAFLMADRDQSGFLVLGEFYNFLQAIYQNFGLNRPLNQQVCQ